MSVQAIGQAVRREEDLRLLKGRGRYVDDIREPNEARGYVLRSPHAHARIFTLDARRALAAPGVIAVLTGEDLRRRGLGTLMPQVRRRRRNGAPAFVCPQPLLARDRVRYVGDPVAFIVADTLDQAKDAAELIDISYEPLPAAISAEAALAADAPAVWDENPGNEAFFHEIGDKAAVDAAFAKADRIVRHTIPINRVTANSMEPRGCLAHYDPDQDRYTIRCTIQSVHATRAALADRIFKLPQHQFRVVCDNMGGGFGMKGGCYPEYGLSLWASEVTGRPVRWIAERSEGLLSDEQGRGSVVETELALDREGRFLALRAQWKAAIGAYFSTDRPTIPLTIGLGCLVNTYGIPAVHAQVIAVLTNTMSIAPYRGGSRPEPIYVIETIIDKAAHELGIEPAELRRRNTIPAEAMPFTTVLQQTYDSGDFVKNLDDCLALGRLRPCRRTPRSREEARQAARCRRSDGGRRLRRPRLRACRDPLRPVGRRRADDRQHGSRPGPRHDLQAGAVGKARHRRRADPLPLRRQRPRDDGDRHLRVALGAARRLGDRRRRRPADRQGAQDRRPHDGSRDARRRIQPMANSRLPAPTGRSASSTSPSSRSRLRICRTTSRPASRSGPISARPAARPSPAGRIAARSRSTRRPAKSH